MVRPLAWALHGLFVIVQTSWFNTRFITVTVFRAPFTARKKGSKPVCLLTCRDSTRTILLRFCAGLEETSEHVEHWCSSPCLDLEQVLRERAVMQGLFGQTCLSCTVSAKHSATPFSARDAPALLELGHSSLAPCLFYF